MSKPTPLRRILSEAGPLIAVTVAATLLFGAVGPASAQFFDFGFGRPPPRPPQQLLPRGAQQPPQQQQGSGNGFFSPFQQMFPGGAPPQAQRPVESSRAPPPEKRDTPAERNVLVLGDAMADWLAYGLEDALSEQPEIGVIRKHKTVSGLIRYQPKGEPADWVAAAKGILATEKPDVIVVMLGLNDRIPIRETSADKTDAKTDARTAADAKKTDKDNKTAADGKADGKPGTPSSDTASKPDDKRSDSEMNPDDQTDSDTPSIIAPEKSGRQASGTYEFRDDKWIELYSKKIDDMIAVVKSKGVPIVWVGLPAVRGQKATSDMLFLDALYRDEAGKAGITYVDVWDGFVDEAGRFMPQGPDFEGQTRRLRSADGVFFTKAGARKLAHYVEREVTRLLALRSGPIELPSEPGIPDVSVRPGGQAPRPLAGPIVPLVAASVGSDELLGGPGTRSAAVDALAARAFVKGEALTPPAGRADDFTWPRREVGRLEPGKDVPVATPANAGAPVASASPSNGASPTLPQQPAAPKKKPPPVASSPGFFNFNMQPASPPPARTRPRDGAPRPPANVGRAASGPDGILTR